LPQRLDADAQPVAVREVLSRKRRTEIGATLTNRREDRTPQGVAKLSIARVTALTRRQCRRPVSRERKTQPKHLAMAEADQVADGGNRQPAIQQIDQSAKPRQAPMSACRSDISIGDGSDISILRLQLFVA
jgi:hypothetical protein